MRISISKFFCFSLNMKIRNCRNSKFTGLFKVTPTSSLCIGIITQHLTPNGYLGILQPQKGCSKALNSCLLWYAYKVWCWHKPRSARLLSEYSGCWTVSLVSNHGMKSKFIGDRKGIFGLRFNECCIYLLSLSIHVFVCLLFGLLVILSLSLSGRT